MDKEWDAVVLVLMDEDFNPFEMYLAERDVLLGALQEDDSKRQAWGGVGSQVQTPGALCVVCG